MNKVYLKLSVVVEPLVWYWYAWPHLIPPVTCAKNIKHRYIPLMESYLSSPEQHEVVHQNKKRNTGPYIDIKRKGFHKIKELLEKTKHSCKGLIRLSETITTLDNMLLSQAKGMSMDAPYVQVPTELKGLLELVYDINNFPSIRLIEPMVYRRYSQHNGQFINLVDSKTSKRAFYINTPRIEKPLELNINIPLGDQRLDKLYSSHFYPTCIDRLIDEVDVETKEINLFKNFFQEEKNASRYNKVELASLRVRYFGHACILLETRDTSILLDPLISYEHEVELERYTYLDLPERIDFVLITHGHPDHMMFETLMKIRHKINTIVIPNNLTGSIVDPSLKLILQDLAFKIIVTVNELESITIPGGEILALPFLGEHADLNIQAKTNSLIELRGKKFFFTADSNNLSRVYCQEVFQEIKDVEILFLGMECVGSPLRWLYGPSFTQQIDREYDDMRRMNGSGFIGAWEFIRQFDFNSVCIYAFGAEPWLDHIMTFDFDEFSPQLVESNRLIDTCVNFL